MMRCKCTVPHHCSGVSIRVQGSRVAIVGPEDKRPASSTAQGAAAAAALRHAALTPQEGRLGRTAVVGSLIDAEIQSAAVRNVICPARIDRAHVTQSDSRITTEQHVRAMRGSAMAWLVVVAITPPSRERLAGGACSAGSACPDSIVSISWESASRIHAGAVSCDQGTALLCSTGSSCGPKLYKRGRHSGNGHLQRCEIPAKLGSDTMAASFANLVSLLHRQRH